MRIGILGAARITPKAIVNPAKVIPTARLQGVAARNPERAAEFAATHGVAEVYASYAELIASPDIDLIYNPLPIHLHAPWTIRALQAGKHVLCEKPFAMNMSEADAMLAAADASGKRLIEAFHYRYHPAFQTCLDWIKAGEIGEITHVEANFDVPIPDDGTEIRHRVETGGGAMMDLGCYPLSWALMVMEGAPTKITAEASLTQAGVDESMRAELGFANGARASLSSNMAADAPFSADMTIAGSDGKIVFNVPIAPYHPGGKLTAHTPRGVIDAPVPRITTYTYQLDAVLSAIRNDTPLPTEGRAILDQQDTLDKIYAAAGLAHLRSSQPKASA